MPLASIGWWRNSNRNRRTLRGPSGSSGSSPGKVRSTSSAPNIVAATRIALKKGLHLPLVYNTSGYERVEMIRLLDGIVDIYMPDFKVWSASSGRTYLKAADYPSAARAAIREMHRQVGDLEMDEQGIARRGLLIRHLVMPGGLSDTREILTWIATELGPNSYVNLMDQYRPAGKVGRDRYPEINRRVSPREMREAREIARGLGLRLDR